MTKLSHYLFLVFTVVLAVAFVKMLKPVDYRDGVEVMCGSVCK